MNTIKTFIACVVVILVVQACTIGHAAIDKPDAYFVIDGCEYMGFRNGERYAFTHKGNCKNPVHKCPETQDTLTQKALDSE